MKEPYEAMDTILIRPEYYPAPIEKLWDALLYFASFRFGMRITKVMLFYSPAYGETGYYVCPRCNVTIEREFVSYCDRCGQHLDWKKYRKAKVVYPGDSPK